MRSHRIAWLVIALLAGCAEPPSSLYVADSGTGSGVSLGQDTMHNPCVQRTSGDGALVYCGRATRPSAQITVSPASLTPMEQAQRGAWRARLDQRFACQPPVQGKLFEASVAQLECQYKISKDTRVSGEFSHVALVTEIGGKDYFGDADPSAAVLLQRAIGVLSGKVPQEKAAALVEDPGTEAFRKANQAANSHDLTAYDDLMETGDRANLSEDFAAAEAAFRQAAALQPADSPAAVDASIHLALQLANLGRYAESDAIFKNEAVVLDNSGKSQRGGLIDPTVVPRLALYNALALLDRNRPQEALPLLTRAEQEFTAVVPPDLLAGSAPATISRASGGLEAMVANLNEQQLFRQPTIAAALLGLITTKRAQAVAALMLGHLEASETDAKAAETLASRHGLTKEILEARILRTTAMIYAAQGNKAGSLDLLTRSANDFRDVFPNSRPLAETLLLQANASLQQGQTADGEQACRNAIDLLSKLNAGGVSPPLILPCLDAFAAGAAGKNDADAQSAYAEMFLGAQLAQSSVTSAQIAQSAARLAELQRDTPLGEAIRTRDIDKDKLDRLLAQSAEAARVQSSGQQLNVEEVRRLKAQTAQAQIDYDNAAAAVHAAAPNYGQLVQETVSAQQVFALLAPDEALAELVLGETHGWTLLLRHGRIMVSHIEGGAPAMQKLVNSVRASMSPAPGQLPPAFDTAAAQKLYDATLRGTDDLLRGTTALVVAPSGPLLSVPFGLLLTGPAGGDLSSAPWLIQKMTVAHVPAPENFVDLRKLAGGTHAPRPWIGFGDAVPVTQAQANATFQTAACAQRANELALLPRLTGTRQELNDVGALFGAAGQTNEILGPQFTIAAVRGADLKDYQVVHFATHGFLPTDLTCQSEPSLLTSPPAKATDASSALLDASEIAGLSLNADAVILSACNSGGPQGERDPGSLTSGESLSGLARSFFYAGAHSVLATHWNVNDQVTRILVVGTMKNYHQDPPAGLASALALEQRDLLRQAADPRLSALAHPFYWAPLALIGDGGRPRPLNAASLASDTRL